MEKNGPIATFDLFFLRVGLALGWGVRRFHDNTYMFSNPTEFGESQTPYSVCAADKGLNLNHRVCKLEIVAAGQKAHTVVSVQKHGGYSDPRKKEHSYAYLHIILPGKYKKRSGVHTDTKRSQYFRCLLYTSDAADE